MRHLSRRFSGYVFLYVVITTIVIQGIWYLGLYFEQAFLFVSQHGTILFLLRRFIFILPIIAVAIKRYPMRQVLRVHAFRLSQLGYTLGIAACMYFSMYALNALLSKLHYAIMYPYFSIVSDYYFTVSRTPVWPDLFTSSLVLVILEGFVYQGVLLSGCWQMRPHKACLTVGLLYALVHFNLISFIPSAILGFTLCYITLRANSIFPGMIGYFLYLLLDHLNIAYRLNQYVLSPIGLGENAAAVIAAVVFILLGGWLLVKMPAKKYRPGSAKAALQRLRPVFPGLFSVSALGRPEEVTGAPENKPDGTAQDARQLAFETVLEEAEAAPAGVQSDPRQNNPMIVGVFISATLTAVLFGLTVLSALGYFGG